MMMMISQIKSPLEKMLWFYSLRTALCESIRYQAKSEQKVRKDLIPRVRHGEKLHCVRAFAIRQSLNKMALGTGVNCTTSLSRIY